VYQNIASEGWTELIANWQKATISGILSTTRMMAFNTVFLVKAYGILFNVVVSGKAGKFSIVPLLLNIGSGIALLGIATVICDVLVTYVVKRRKYYKQSKYQLVEDTESLLPLGVNDEARQQGNADSESRD
jgi:hypothetical protein